MIRPRAIASLAIASVLGAGLLACGGAPKPSVNGDTGRGPNQLGFAECMRSHGVSGFPDPTPPGAVVGGAHNTVFGFVLPDTMDIEAPAFQAALQTCSKVILAGIHRPPRPPGDTSAQLRFAQCMRANGVPDYPDPSAPTNGPILSTGASVNLDTPAAKHAAKVCGASP